MTDHKHNEEIGEELGIEINTATGTVERNGQFICEERLSPKLLYQYRPKGRRWKGRLTQEDGTILIFATETGHELNARLLCSWDI
jgi:hypothetical protein